jgi:ubiquinone/menaquinone biosynthesis C-methylase UbiE
MMNHDNYIMEDIDENLRLDLKTDVNILKKQALWAGIKPGMRIADMGCGTGKTTFYLNKLVQPSGSSIGVDISEKRINDIKSEFKCDKITYHNKDLRETLSDLGKFDFIWVRFVLEFYKAESFEIVENLSSLLKPGGIICLVDLDHNCLNHYGIPEKLERSIHNIIAFLEKKTDFDAYAGRKLYSHLYDLKFKDICVDMAPHHLIYGEMKKNEIYNWRKKIEIPAKNSGYRFKEFKNGFKGFQEACSNFFDNPRRFTYTPIICCRGRKE